MQIEPGKQIDIQALMLLEKGPHEMERVINDEETMAAALVFTSLKDRGLIFSVIGDTRITYHLTDRGLGWLYENV